jgi:hypothetical protein
MRTGLGIMGSMYSFAGFAVLASLIATAPARAQTQSPAPQLPSTFNCPKFPNRNSDLPQIKPLFRSVPAVVDEDNLDCLAWQGFIYLMWPANASVPGFADPSRHLGASGPTVWETYRTSDTVFLPEGRDPGPWQKPTLNATLPPSLAQEVASGATRHLTMKSKISPAVLANIQRGAAFPPAILKAIEQASGDTLYDLNGEPVYYEVAIDEPEYEYIRNNRLYNANQQAAFAQTHVIALPPGTTSGTTENPTDAVEIKAAWKVLSDAEKHSGRFHTAQALLGDSKTPVTVGLVGFHVFIVTDAQGVWATFAQVDNVPKPSRRPVTSGTFNFFKPNCKVSGTDKPCPVNDPKTRPSQVKQRTSDGPKAKLLNSYMHSILQQCKECDPNPWQYYKLIDAQWPKNGVDISNSKAPVSTPLPDGTPNVPLAHQDMLNPVIETFIQWPVQPKNPKPHGAGFGCLTCHQFASTAAVLGSPKTYAAGYSFILGNAQMPAEQQQ